MTMTLLWRVFATNAAVLVAATMLLALTPATVSFPLALTEAVVLAAGLPAMLGINFVLLRRVLRPLDRLRHFMAGVNPLEPGARAVVADADGEVAELTRAFNDMIARLEDERRESARAALAAQETERGRIARELHDEVGQTLTAVVLQLERAARDTGAPSVAEAREAVRETLEEVREIARRLRPEALDDLGLRSALTSLTVQVSRRTGLRVHRRLARELAAVSAEEELVVYRVVQEALTNVARHSGASDAWVDLGADGGQIVLSVRDDGCGFESSAGATGAGLRGMRERAMLIGATLEVRSRLGEGTSVRLRLAP
jgi:two-component system, NarL family, sensor histidine kinase UhpB